MKIILIIYILGCILSWLLVAYHNDKFTNLDEDKIEFSWIFLSWFTVIIVGFGIIIELCNKSPYPSFKRKNKKSKTKN